MSKEKIYNDEELKQILISYANNSNCKLTYSLLEKETGIGRQTWSRRMKDEIKILNAKHYIKQQTNLDDITLPNIAETVNKFYYNKEKLIEKLLWYNDTIQMLYVKTSELYKDKEELNNIKIELENIKIKNKNLIKDLNFYKNEYLKVFLEESKCNGLDSNHNSCDKLYKLRSKEISQSPLSELCPQLFEDY